MATLVSCTFCSEDSVSVYFFLQYEGVAVAMTCWPPSFVQREKKKHSQYRVEILVNLILKKTVHNWIKSPAV